MGLGLVILFFENRTGNIYRRQHIRLRQFWTTAFFFFFTYIYIDFRETIDEYRGQEEGGAKDGRRCTKPGKGDHEKDVKKIQPRRKRNTMDTR